MAVALCQKRERSRFDQMGIEISKLVSTEHALAGNGAALPPAPHDCMRGLAGSLFDTLRKEHGGAGPACHDVSLHPGGSLALAN